MCESEYGCVAEHEVDDVVVVQWLWAADFLLRLNFVVVSLGGEGGEIGLFVLQRVSLRERVHLNTIFINQPII